MDPLVAVSPRLAIARSGALMQAVCTGRDRLSTCARRSVFGLDAGDGCGQSRSMETPRTDVSLDQLDPDRRRRRLQLLAEYADATTQRIRMSPERERIERIRGLVSARKRLAS